MDDLINNLKPDEATQKLAESLSVGDKASLAGNFSVAAECYETALAIIDAQKPFDFERTRDCLNKLLNVYSHLENSEKVQVLSHRLSQIENTQTIITLQASGEFFAGRSQPTKAASAYAKALKAARNSKPLNSPLLFELKKAYTEQKKLAQIDGNNVDTVIDDGDDLVSEGELETAAVHKNRVMRGVGSLSESKPKANPLAVLDIAKAPIFLLIVSAAFLVSAGQLFVSADVKSDSSIYALPESFGGLQFATCDQEKSLKFLKDGQCILSAPSGAIQMKYCLLNERSQNFSELFHGYLKRKEYWLKTQGEELVDRNNVVFFRPTAAEKTIINRMWFYAKCAQDQYKENKIYPSSLDKCKRTYQNFAYVNPFTGKSDCAELLTRGMQNNNAIDLKSRGVTDRQWRPGAILCLQQDTKHFQVQGFDRVGKPFVSSDPSRYFVIELEYGKTLSAEPKNIKKRGAEDDLLKDVREDRSSVIYLVSDDRFEGLIEALRRLPQIILWVALLSASVCLVLSSKFKQPQKVQLISKRTIYGCVIALIIFYVIAF